MTAAIDPPVLPHELQTERLLLRRYRPDDAERLEPVLQANVRHLEDWIPSRIAAPAPVEELRERLAEFEGDFAAGREWRYAMIWLEDGSLVGELSLFPRSSAGRTPRPAADRMEIGYWLSSRVTGRGLVTEAARAALALCASLPWVTQVEIHCDVLNKPSAAVPARLGFRLVNDPDPAAPAYEGREMIWIYDLSPPRLR